MLGCSASPHRSQEPGDRFARLALVGLVGLARWVVLAPWLALVLTVQEQLAISRAGRDPGQRTPCRLILTGGR